MCALEPTSQIHYLGNGYFECDGVKYSRVEMERFAQKRYQDGLSSVNEEQMNEVNNQANKMQAYTFMLQWARTAQNNKDSSHDDTSSHDDADDHGGGGEKFSLPGYGAEKHSFQGWCNLMGIPESNVSAATNSKTTWENKWQDNIDSISNELQTVQTQSQQDMLNYKETVGYIDNSTQEQSYTDQQWQQLVSRFFS